MRVPCEKHTNLDTCAHSRTGQDKHIRTSQRKTGEGKTRQGTTRQTDKLNIKRQTNRKTDGRINRQTDGWTDRRTDGRTDGQTDGRRTDQSDTVRHIDKQTNTQTCPSSIFRLVVCVYIRCLGNLSRNATRQHLIPVCAKNTPDPQRSTSTSSTPRTPEVQC